MAVTTLDAKTALLVIDLQKGVFSLLPAEKAEALVAPARALTRAFRERNLPLVLVTVAGGAPGRTEQPRRSPQFADGWSDLIPELDQQPSDHRLVKHTWGAFMNTGLDELLKRLGVTHVVVIGVSTSIGVESTARQAYEHGFNVTLAIDAMADLNPEAHFNSVTRIFPRLGETGTTQEIIQLLEGTRSVE
ncbi:MAG: isochorismatase family cysteine hydrolase [Pseudomonadota bacterium]